MTDRGKAPSMRELLAMPSDRRWRGGVACATCAHKRAKEINQDIDEFRKAKEAGHPMPWSKFIELRLRPEYGLTVKTGAIQSHIRSCRGIEAS